MSLGELEAECAQCRRCGLSGGRNKAVFGVGRQDADIMFVGEGPGYHEDMAGEPFVGAAGQLLDKMLAAIGLRRSDVYIANVVKCRPPNNRDPLPEERQACLPFLRMQFLRIRPKIIVCLGRVAAQALIDGDFRITKERGTWFQRKGVHMIATYHPSALLRDEDKKRPAWEDFKAIRAKLDEIGKTKENEEP